MSTTNEREIIVTTLTDMQRENAYNHVYLRKVLNSRNDLAAFQKAFVTEVVNGSIRNLILIDYIIDSLSKTPTAKMKPVIRNILRTAVYQIIFMTRVPDSAACNEAVKLAKQKGFAQLAPFVNGVLRNIARSKDNIKYPDKSKELDRYLSVLYSYPLWIIKRWLCVYSFEETESLCRYGGMTPKVSLCVNPLKTDEEALRETITLEGMEAEPGYHALRVSRTADIASTASFQAGLYHVMDEGAIAAAEILGARPGETVMDVCAAPGGKSFYCAYRMNDTGRIIAWDKHGYKIGLMDETASRLGISIIESREMDATVRRTEYFGKADRVLIDAPCTGFGIARKKPDIKYTKTEKDIAALAALQRRILSACADYVKPGGVLVYCTCTITEEENTDQIKWFTGHFPFSPDPAEIELPEGFRYRRVTDGAVQLWPGENHDGFFISRMIRN